MHIGNIKRLLTRQYHVSPKVGLIVGLISISAVSSVIAMQMQVASSRSTTPAPSIAKTNYLPSQEWLASQVARPTVSPTPTPTIPTSQTLAEQSHLVDCQVWGKTQRISPALCQSFKESELRLETHWQNQRNDQEWLSLETPIPSHPSWTSPVPTATPTPCDEGKRAAIVATYEQDSAALYREYQQAMGRIVASGVADSSATQMAHTAYTMSQKRLDEDYTAALSELNCQ